MVEGKKIEIMASYISASSFFSLFSESNIKFRVTHTIFLISNLFRYIPCELFFEYQTEWREKKAGKRKEREKEVDTIKL